MTTGTIINDDRVTETLGCGIVSHGYNSYRDWTGGDRASPHDRTEHIYTLVNIEENDPVLKWRDNYSPPGVYPYTGTIYSCFGAGSASVKTFDANDVLKAVNKLGNKIRDHDFNLGNFIGESRQSVALVADTATRVAKMLHHLRDGNLYKAKNAISKVKISRGHVLQKRFPKPFTAREASDAVLELQYGWKPLLSDVHSSMHGLAAIHHKPRVNRYKITREVYDNRLMLNGSGHVFERKHSIARHYRAVIRSQPSFTTLLHLNDPLSVLWEVTPWSFVADWFLPIGDYLGAVDVFRNFDFESIWYTEVDKREDRYKDSGASFVEIEGTPNYYYKIDQVSRRSSALDAAMLPFPTFKPLKQALMPEHLVNAFALLTSNTTRFRKQLKF